MRAIKEKLKARVERAQQPRGGRREVDAIVDCWLCKMMAENLFSKTII